MIFVKMIDAREFTAHTPHELSKQLLDWGYSRNLREEALTTVRKAQASPDGDCISFACRALADTPIHEWEKA